MQVVEGWQRSAAGEYMGKNEACDEAIVRASACNDRDRSRRQRQCGAAFAPQAQQGRYTRDATCRRPKSLEASPRAREEHRAHPSAASRKCPRARGQRISVAGGRGGSKWTESVSDA